MMFLWPLIICILLYFLLSGKFDLNHYSRKDAKSLLDERLAKGEISIEEYNVIKETIKENKR